MMRHVLVMLLSMGVFMSYSQDKILIDPVKVGDEFFIGRPEKPFYQFIGFPSASEIVRKGGNPNFKSVEGVRVIVTSVKTAKDGGVKIKLKQRNGDLFFGSYYSVTADFKSALESGELYNKAI